MNFGLWGQFYSILERYLAPKKSIICPNLSLLDVFAVKQPPFHPAKFSSEFLAVAQVDQKNFRLWRYYTSKNFRRRRILLYSGASVCPWRLLYSISRSQKHRFWGLVLLYSGASS
jgi:hypothetical protein